MLGQLKVIRIRRRSEAWLVILGPRQTIEMIFDARCPIPYALPLRKTMLRDCGISRSAACYSSVSVNSVQTKIGSLHLALRQHNLVFKFHDA